MEDTPDEEAINPSNTHEGGRSRAPIDAQSMMLLHSASLALWDKEADRFWVRNNLLLLVNAALLGATMSVEADPFLRMTLCLFGIAFSWLWLQMNNKSGYYVARWRPVIEAIERQIEKTFDIDIMPLTIVRPDNEVFVKSGLKRSLLVFFGIVTPKKDAGEIMHLVIACFFIAWVILGAYIAFINWSSISEMTPELFNFNIFGSLHDC